MFFRIMWLFESFVYVYNFKIIFYFYRKMPLEFRQGLDWICKSPWVYEHFNNIIIFQYPLFSIPTGQSTSSHGVYEIVIPLIPFGN